MHPIQLFFSNWQTASGRLAAGLFKLSAQGFHSLDRSFLEGA
jgi:hypothetical protein